MNVDKSKARQKRRLKRNNPSSETCANKSLSQHDQLSLIGPTLRRSQKKGQVICAARNHTLHPFVERNSASSGCFSPECSPIVVENDESCSVSESALANISPDSENHPDNVTSKSQLNLPRSGSVLSPCGESPFNVSCTRKLKRRRTCISDRNRTLDSFTVRTLPCKESSSPILLSKDTKVETVTPEEQLHYGNLSPTPTKSEHIPNLSADGKNETSKQRIWTDAYSPLSLSEMVLNCKQLPSLINWMKSWDIKSQLQSSKSISFSIFTTSFKNLEGGRSAFVTVPITRMVMIHLYQILEIACSIPLISY